MLSEGRTNTGFVATTWGNDMLDHPAASCPEALDASGAAQAPPGMLPIAWESDLDKSMHYVGSRYAMPQVDLRRVSALRFAVQWRGLALR